MAEIKLTLPKLGYTICSRETVFERNKVEDILKQCLQKKITKIVKHKNGISIIKHVAVCPICGKETPAYYKSQNVVFSPEEIKNFIFYQLSFFDEREQKELIINTPLKSIDNYFCPNCKIIIPPSKGERHIVVKTGKKVSVSLKLQIEDVFKINWANDIDIVDFDLFETITFNLTNGHTYLLLENSFGKQYAVKDISKMNLSEFSKDPIFEILKYYKPVFRHLKQAFLKYWDENLPFSNKELNTEKLVLLTAFVGYKRDFYDSIPYVKSINDIDKSFLIISKKLHSINHIPKLYALSKLPKVKSIKRILFSQPALLFYKNELEHLWCIIKDINYFRNMLELRTSNLFKTLAYLHKQPMVFLFLQEYTTIMGIKATFRLLDESEGWKYYAPYYLTMSQYNKKVERTKWKNNFIISFQSCFLSSSNFGVNFSIPIPLIDKCNTNYVYPKNCNIENYHFIRLKNSYEYNCAGKDLHNCLVAWQSFSGNVYGIMNSGKYVGAVEIEKNEIIQARTINNNAIDVDKPLLKAFNIWKERNRLKFATQNCDFI